MAIRRKLEDDGIFLSTNREGSLMSRLLNNVMVGIRGLVLVLGVVGMSGTVVFEGTFESEILSTNRFYRVYLPPGYESGTARYPVLYVNDGQNAFSTAGRHAAFGWGNW